jgi:hypothetical protein
MALWVASNSSKKKVGDPVVDQRLTERLGPQVQVELVTAAGVDIDGLHGAQACGTFWNHAHGVPTEPAFPHVGNQRACRRVEGKMDGAVRIGEIADRHGPFICQDGNSSSMSRIAARLAHQSGTGGPEFKSRRSDQKFSSNSNTLARPAEFALRGNNLGRRRTAEERPFRQVRSAGTLSGDQPCSVSANTMAVIAQ